MLVRSIKHGGDALVILNPAIIKRLNLQVDDLFRVTTDRTSIFLTPVKETKEDTALSNTSDND